MQGWEVDAHWCVGKSKKIHGWREYTAKEVGVGGGRSHESLLENFKNFDSYQLNERKGGMVSDLCFKSSLWLIR